MRCLFTTRLGCSGRTAGCSWSLKSELFLRRDSHDEASLARSPQSGLILILMLTLLFTHPSVERYAPFSRLVIMDWEFMGTEDNKGTIWSPEERGKSDVLWPACKLSLMSSKEVKALNGGEEWREKWKAHVKGKNSNIHVVLTLPVLCVRITEREDGAWKAWRDNTDTLITHRGVFVYLNWKWQM